MRHQSVFFLRCAFLCLLFPPCRIHANTSGDYRSQGGTVYSDIIYSQVGGRKLALDIYLPSETKKQGTYPVIVWIHGGGWRWGGKDPVPVISLTNAGFALVSIEYRLDGYAKYPAQIDDCRAALRWLHQHASEYHLDPKHVGILGASAGGHLAALLGTTGGNSPDFPRVQAVCALYPPTNLITVVKEKDRGSYFTLVSFLLGGSVDEKRDLAWEGSPIRYVSPGDPPFFLIHGQLDTLVPVEQSQSLHQALRKAGVPSQLEIIPDQKHGFYPDAALTREVIRFFRKNLIP